MAGTSVKLSLSLANRPSFSMIAKFSVRMIFCDANVPIVLTKLFLSFNHEITMQLALGIEDLEDLARNI